MPKRKPPPGSEENPFSIYSGGRFNRTDVYTVGAVVCLKLYADSPTGHGEGWTLLGGIVLDPDPARELASALRTCAAAAEGE